MANLTTVNDILLDALWKAGEITDPTMATTSDPFYLKGLNYINEVHLDLKRGNGPQSPDANITFRWAIKDPASVLILEPKYDTGTISVANNSASATLSTVSAASRAGWYLIIPGEDDVPRVLTHIGGSAAVTLDGVWTGDTGATETFKLVNIQYDLGSSDIIRIVEPFRVYSLGTEGDEFLITSMDSAQFASEWPVGDLRSGVPTKFRIVKETDGTVKIQVNKYQDTDLLRVEYDYIDISTDLTVNDTPEVPRDYRAVMSNWVAGLLLQDKNDNKAAGFFQLAQAGFLTMVKNEQYKSHRTSTRLGKVSPRRDKAGRRSLRNITNVVYNT